MYAIALKTYRSYIYLTFLMFFAILTFGLIGMELYAGKFDQSTVLGQLHSYDDPFRAWVTVFNIMCNDDWYGVLVLGTGVTRYFTIVYLFLLIFLVNYLTYGLVMAILLDGFGKYLEEEEENSENEYVQRKVKAIDKLKKQMDSDESDPNHTSSSSSRYERASIS